MDKAKLDGLIVKPEGVKLLDRAEVLWVFKKKGLEPVVGKKGKIPSIHQLRFQLTQHLLKQKASKKSVVDLDAEDAEKRVACEKAELARQKAELARQEAELARQEAELARQEAVVEKAEDDLIEANQKAAAANRRDRG